MPPPSQGILSCEATGNIPTALPKLYQTAFRYARTVAYTERREALPLRQKCPANSYDDKNKGKLRKCARKSHTLTSGIRQNKETFRTGGSKSGKVQKEGYPTFDPYHDRGQ